MFVNSSFLPVHKQVIDDIVIVDSEDENLMPAGKKLTSDTLAKIDEILYADIGKLHKMDKVDKVRILVFSVWIYIRSHQQIMKIFCVRSVATSCLRWTKF